MEKVLIIAPASLVANWQIKLRQLAPTLITAAYHGKRRALGVSDPDVIVTSYETANSEVELLAKMPWYCIVADEAQWVSDAGMEEEGIKLLPAVVRIGIIGRFIEHRLNELWSIMDFLNPGYLGSPKQFKDRFEHPILREHDQRRAVLLSKITAPFMLRRMKADKEVLPELPQPLRLDVFAPLAPEQEDMYTRLVQRDMKLMLEEKDANRRQTIVGAFVRDLRKICNHPYQYSRAGSKEPRLSGKIQLLLSLLENNYENGEKTLVLTQFPETGEILTKAIKDAFGKEPLFIHDALGMVQRDEMVFSFQKNPVFDTLVQVATPTHPGQSLSSATSIILFDRVWNPALETQLVERASRISQSKTALLWRLSSAFTFEERLDELLRSNKELKQLTIAAGENWIGELPVAELEWVFG
jgi:SNF2 family DNA or RNA helicase